MKNFELTSMGVQEMNSLEMQETDGGVILIILAICALAVIITSTVEDASKASPTTRTDSGKIQIPIDVPIGY